MRGKILLWFIMGMGADVRLVASLSLTEAICFAWAPILFFKEANLMKRHGVWKLFVLSVLVVAGCALASIVNHSALAFVIRGMAATSVIPCVIVVLHHMLRIDPINFKWYFGGSFVSVLVTTLFSGLGTIDTSDPLYWVHHIELISSVLLYGWYLKLPWKTAAIYSVIMGLVCLKVTASGRAVSLTYLAAGIIFWIGGKERSTMRLISKHFLLWLTIGIISLPLANFAYKKAAMSGWLGEKSRAKYEAQTQGRSGLLSLLLGGRKEAFIGFLAIKDSPIVGFGPWAIDRDGYNAEFIRRYGTLDDYKQMLRYSTNVRSDCRLISCHSHITEFWLWYGVLGLILWIVIIYYMIRFMRQDISAIPMWFGWLAGSVPVFLWHICFSPFSRRVMIPMTIVAMLLARAYRLGAWRPHQDIERLKV